MASRPSLDPRKKRGGSVRLCSLLVHDVQGLCADLVPLLDHPLSYHDGWHQQQQAKNRQVHLRQYRSEPAEQAMGTPDLGLRLYL